MGKVALSWSFTGSCPPYSGVLGSDAGMSYAVGAAGTYIDQPPPTVCWIGVNYALTLTDAAGHQQPPLTGHSPAWCKSPAPSPAASQA